MRTEAEMSESEARFHATCDRLEAKLDRMFYLMIGIGYGIIATFVAVIAS